MKICFLSLIFFLTSYSFGQIEYYSCDENGNIFQSDVLGSCKTDKGNYPVFSDIAFTPNGNLFGIDTVIKKIDLNTQSISQIIVPLDVYGSLVVGAGLVAIDNDYLITNKLDSLCVVNINTGLATNIGYIGHLCAGDLAFLDGYLYMTTSFNYLLKIKLNAITHLIESVQNIGTTDMQESIYGLFTANDGSNNSLNTLYGFSGFSLYKINTTNATTEFVCQVTDKIVNGSTTFNSPANTYFTNDVNVLTPNNDGVNDFLAIDEHSIIDEFTVLNRWGQTVFYSNSIPFNWYGTDQKGNELDEGVYFYTYKNKSCSQIESRLLYGSITILR